MYSIYWLWIDSKESVTLRGPRCKSLYKFLESKESDVKTDDSAPSWTHLFIVYNIFSVAKQVCAISKQILREERELIVISLVLSEDTKNYFNHHKVSFSCNMQKGTFSGEK